MKAIAIVMLLASGWAVGCDKGGGGVEEAKRQAQLEDKAKGAASPPAKKMSTPVPGSAHVPCNQLIDAPALAAYQSALGETQPLSVQTTAEADAAASCSIVRGGKRPSEAEQQGLLKTQGRLGVMPGDVLCTISAFCWTIEDAEHFRKRCTEGKLGKDDDTMGNYACMTVTATGEDDVESFKFFDEDTKCILGVRGGPSMVDNDLIRKCAKTARDTIGPAQISMTPPAAPAPAAPAGSAAP
jgi:hypothetical protein